MENSLKGLILAAGTIITCLIISLGFFIAREAKDSASTGAGQISKLNAEFLENDKVIYDATEVSGSEVINAIRKFKNEAMGITVTTKKSTTSYNYVIDEDKGTITDSDVKEYNAGTTANDSKFINPTARFMGKVIRDINGTIIGIKFTQA
ncbi:MAG: hypothetical protein ACI4EV_09655 [Lachnospiraceae bacterium]